MLVQTVSSIALEDVGLQESPRGSNEGPDLQKFFEADDLEIDGETDGYPWCAAAVSYWVQQYLRRNDIKGVSEPRIAGVRFFEGWAKKNGLTVSQTPRDNSIVVFKFSHIGVVRRIRSNGEIVCIEGNTNDGGSREGFAVCEKNRKPEECKLFIYLPQ